MVYEIRAADIRSNASPITLGWGNLSDRGNRKGNAGYELDPVLSYTTWHVRRRVLTSDLGRFATRDPIGYADGINLYEYVHSNPLDWIDPFGLLPPSGGGGAPPGGGRRTPADLIYPPPSSPSQQASGSKQRERGRREDIVLDHVSVNVGTEDDVLLVVPRAKDAVAKLAPHP